MKTAIITGASSGLGEQYAIEIAKSRPEIEEIWLIARRKEKLEELSEKLNKKVKILPFDITNKENLNEYKTVLENEKPEVLMLVNNAGFGKLGDFDKMEEKECSGMVKLNCEALTVMTSITLPFMPKGSEIINSCSIASFAPNTRMAVYSSTKAYVMSFSRAIRQELKCRKINCLSVCPGPMDTEFLSLAGIEKGTSFTFDALPRVSPSVMAIKSLKASKKGRAVYTNRFFYKLYRLLAKILPTSLIMKLAGA